jgi:hypothetical protein
MIVVSFCAFRCFCLNVLFTYSASISHSAPAKSSVLLKIKFFVIFSRLISHRRRGQSFSFSHLPCWSMLQRYTFAFVTYIDCVCSRTSTRSYCRLPISAAPSWFRRRVVISKSFWSNPWLLVRQGHCETAFALKTFSVTTSLTWHIRQKFKMARKSSRKMRCEKNHCNIISCPKTSANARSQR